MSNLDPVLKMLGNSIFAETAVYVASPQLATRTSTTITLRIRREQQPGQSADDRYGRRLVEVPPASCSPPP
jgi:hypothetical protein